MNCLFFVNAFFFGTYLQAIFSNSVQNVSKISCTSEFANRASQSMASISKLIASQFMFRWKKFRLLKEFRDGLAVRTYSRGFERVVAAIIRLWSERNGVFATSIVEKISSLFVNRRSSIFLPLVGCSIIWVRKWLSAKFMRVYGEGFCPVPAGLFVATPFDHLILG